LLNKGEAILKGRSKRGKQPTRRKKREEISGKGGAIERIKRGGRASGGLLP